MRSLNPNVLFIAVILIHGESQAAAPPGNVGPAALRLIAQLGDDSFLVREAAEQALAALPVRFPELLAAESGTDREIARRARRICSALASKEQERAAKRWLAATRSHDIGLLAELAGPWAGLSSDSCVSQSVLDVGWRVIRAGGVSPQWTPTTLGELPAERFRSYLARKMPSTLTNPPCESIDVESPRFGPGDSSAVVARGDTIAVSTGFSSSLAVSRRTSTIPSLVATFLISGGDVRLGICDSSVIVCEGDVWVKMDVHDCIIIASGNVTVAEGSVHRSVLLAGGNIKTQPYAISHSDARAVGDAPASLIRHLPCRVEGNANDALRPVRFFTFTRLGVLTGPDLTTDAVIPRSPFATAGLLPGDRFVAVGLREPSSPESLRLLLRADVARHGEAHVVVRRAGKLQSLTVRLH